MKVVLLGSGGWIPTGRRETCSALVREGSTAVLLDAGTGVARLVERPDLLAGAEALEIVLTHFHLDHVIGLSYLPALDSGLSKRVWVPGQRLYGTPGEQLLRRLLDQPLFAADLGTIVDEVVEIGEGPLSLGPLELTTRIQERHSHPTLALRLGDELAYCTDTAFDPGNADFASGARLLFHEAWYAAASTGDPTHSAAGEAGRVAAGAGVRELVLIHVNPQLGDEEELLQHARDEFPASVVGEDLLERTGAG